MVLLIGLSLIKTIVLKTRELKQEFHQIQSSVKKKQRIKKTKGPMKYVWSDSVQSKWLEKKNPKDQISFSVFHFLFSFSTMASDPALLVLLCRTRRHTTDTLNLTNIHPLVMHESQDIFLFMKYLYILIIIRLYFIIIIFHL